MVIGRLQQEALLPNANLRRRKNRCPGEGKYPESLVEFTLTKVGTDASGTTETFDVFKLAGPAIKTSSATWNSPQSGIDHSASQMHSALDYNNNTGQTQPDGTHYAYCESEHLFEALSICQQSHELV